MLTIKRWPEEDGGGKSCWAVCFTDKKKARKLRLTLPTRNQIRGAARLHLSPRAKDFRIEAEYETHFFCFMPIGLKKQKREMFLRELERYVT